VVTAAVPEFERPAGPDATYELEVVLTDPEGNAATVPGLGFVAPAAPGP
jgi:hypothetical protein